MRYRYILILFLLTVTCMTPAWAQDTRYRVEILVLRQLEQNEEARERLQLPDYSGATDFLTPPALDDGGTAAEGTGGADAVDPETAESVLADEGIEEVTGAELTIAELDPNRLVHLEEMSSAMKEAWRRLRLSGPYRPEQYLSWEQGSEEPFPVLRLHDLDVVMVEDPWAAYRAEPANPGAKAPDTAQATVFADAAGLDALDKAGMNLNDELEGPMLPDPVYYYRLDGTVTLKRTRFLHLELDLQMREPVWSAEIPAAPATGEDTIPPALPASFHVFELKQSRQVRTGRMEYFDGPVLGVLAFLTEIKEESGEAP